VFPAWRLPVAQGVSFFHPFDQRPVFIFPWEGVTIVGTTDVDHHASLQAEPGISPAEVSYLMAAVEARFPSLGITLEDVISTFAGVRPVVGTGKADPSKESRDHVVWQESGLLTVTGGKLTTFQIIAQDALRALQIPEVAGLRSNIPVLKPVNLQLPGAETLPEATRRRLLGRYGSQAPALVAAAQAGELTYIPNTPYLWAELRWACREQVVHLDDLLLRRVRLGNLLPAGGAAILPEIQRICQPDLGWSDEQWQAEVQAYQQLWQRCYSLPPRELIPDWRARLAALHAERAVDPEGLEQAAVLQHRTRRRLGLAIGLSAVAALVALFFLRRKKL
jgi:glycerol-3-phosphate dehydrogenase